MSCLPANRDAAGVSVPITGDGENKVCGAQHASNVLGNVLVVAAVGHHPLAFAGGVNESALIYCQTNSSDDQRQGDADGRQCQSPLRGHSAVAGWPAAITRVIDACHG